MKLITKFVWILLGAFFILSFMTRNNFNPTGKDLLGMESDQTVSIRELNKLINEKVLNPIKECIEAANPHVFMMKCTSGMSFTYDQKFYNESDTLLVYSSAPVEGDVSFIECETSHHLCELRVTYSENLLEVRQSYFSPWMNSEEFIKDFCTNYKAE